MLLKNLTLISEKIPNWIEILIIDNHSEPKVNLSEKLISTFNKNKVKYRIIRNRANIGGGANILRCFENVTTNWFILCGDDDYINPDKLQEVLNIIQENPKLAFIKFSSQLHHYKCNLIETGICALIENGGNFANLLFMSSYVFNARICMQYLRYGYLMNAAYAPHLEIALLAARHNPFLLSSTLLTNANSGSAQWTPLEIWQCSYYLSDSPISCKEREAVIGKIYSGHNVGSELLDIITIQNNPKLKNEASFLRKRAIKNHLFFGRGFKKLLALIAMLISPVMGTFAQRLLCIFYQKLRGKVYDRKFISRHVGL